MNAIDAAIRQAEPDDLNDVRQLLRESDLPFEDIGEHFSDFLIAECNGSLIGAIGIERYKQEGLLRSLVVDARSRGQGLGLKLFEEMERNVAAMGITTLYLLTTTAESFFACNGFIQTDRDAVPELIRNTLEFKSICPASAMCMKKKL